MSRARERRRTVADGDHVLVIAQRAYTPSLWLDMRDAGVAQGASITTLVARTGTNGTQGTGAKKPTFDINSGCAVFDGVDDCLVSDLGLTANDKLSMFMFGHPPNPAGGFVGFEHTAAYFSSNGAVIGTASATPNTLTWGMSGAGTGFITTKIGEVVRGPFVTGASFDRTTNPDTLEATQSSGLFTGPYTTQNNTTGNFNNAPCYIGSRNNGASAQWPGKIGMAFAVKGVVTPAQQQAIVEKYAAARAA